MFLLVICIGVISLTSNLIEAIDDSHTDQIWAAFKDKYNKTYDSPEHENKSRDNFEDNLIHAAIHNLQDEHDYTKDVHEFSDMAVDDQIKVLCGTEMSPDDPDRKGRDFSTSERQAASELNWVTQGKVTRVKHQGNCGSCYIFAAVQSLEGAAAIRWSYGLWELSEQQVLDCDTVDGGCDGGAPGNVFNYIQNNGGIVEERCYPYNSTVGTCHAKDENQKDCFHFWVSSHEWVTPSKDENALAKALAEKGPLSIAVKVNRDFMFYSGGIFKDPNWTGDGGVNHAMLLVGYGTDKDLGQDYWLVKNSWGERWGEKGYIRIARNANNMINVACCGSYANI